MQTKKVKTNVVDWLKCFSIYIAAMAQKYPEVMLPMLAYQLVIVKASQQYDGFYWRVYDTHYWVNAAATGNKNWAQLDTDLYTRFFTGRAKEVSHCLTCHSTIHTDAQYPLNSIRKHPAAMDSLGLSPKRKKWMGNVCFAYNATGSCQFKSCKFEHSCGMCHGNHHTKQCPSSTNQA